MDQTLMQLIRHLIDLDAAALQLRTERDALASEVESLKRELSELPNHPLRIVGGNKTGAET